MKLAFTIFLVTYIIYLISIFYIMITTSTYKNSRDFYIDWLPGGYVIRKLIEKITKLEKPEDKIDEQKI